MRYIQTRAPQHSPIMVADDAKIRLGLNKLDALIRRRFQGDKVCVNVRDNQYAHKIILTQAEFDLKRLSILFEYTCNDISCNACTTSLAKDYPK